MKRPSFQFYPADWRKDAALQSCSIAARGLWIECLCIAHECEPYGHLTINGKPMGVAQVARLVGLSAKECAALFAELEDAGVLSRDDTGTIFSRRMIRDEDIRQRRAAGGEAGSEHGIKGKEYGAKGGRPPKERGVSEPPSNPPPSSSSSSSSSTSVRKETPLGDKSPNPPAAAPPSVGLPPGLLVDTWRAFRDHRQRLRAPLTPHAEQLLLAKLVKLGLAGHDLNSVVEQSIERGWKGFFPLNGSGHAADGIREWLHRTDAIEGEYTHDA